MRRVLGTVVAVLVMVSSAGPAASADPGGGGTPRWTSSYAYGAPAWTNAVALTPDGSTVVETGRSVFPGGHMATVAYDAVTGAQTWATEFPESADLFGTGYALAVSPDGATVYVGGQAQCLKNCDSSSFEGWVTVAFDVATGARLWVARHAAQGGAPYSVAVTPDGSRVIVGATDGDKSSSIFAYDAATGDPAWSVTSAKASGYYGGGLAVSPDGTTVYATQTAPTDDVGCFSSGGYSTSAYLVSDGSVKWHSTYVIPGGSLCGTPTDLGLSPDGATVYVTGYGGDHVGVGLYASGTVAYAAATGTQLWATDDDDVSTLAGDTKVSLGVSPDGSSVFIAGDDCHDYPSCRLTTVSFDASVGNQRWVSRYDGGGRGYTADLEVSPDGTGIYVTGSVTLPCHTDCVLSETDAPLVSYDPGTGVERWAATYPDNAGSALAVSGDGSSVYLAGTFASAASTERGKACTDRCGYSATRFNTRAGPAAFQDPETALAYDGWRGVFDKDAVGGAYRASRTAGAKATFRTPTSRSVTWLTRQGPDQGRARVLVDGHSKGVFDLYAHTAGPHAFTFDGLAKKVHTITVRVLGRKDSASRSTAVAVDGFGFHARSGIVEESSPQVRYDSWHGVTNRHASGGSFRRTGTHGTTFALDFKGRTLTWVTATGPASGRARVVIDGTARTVDLYRPTRHWKVGLRFDHLGRGSHHVTIRPLGRKDPASRSTAVVVDALVAHRR